MRYALLGALLVAACGDPPVGAGDDPSAILGTYVLEGVNGSVVPYVLSESASLRVEIESAWMVLEEGRVYAFETYRREYRQGGGTSGIPSRGEGTFRLSGAGLSFVAESGEAPATAAVMAGARLRVVQQTLAGRGADTLIYVKQ